MEPITPNSPTAERTRDQQAGKEDHEQTEERVREKAGATAEEYRQEAGRAGERASQAVEEAQARGRRMAEDARQSADEALETARQKAADVAARARQKGESLLSGQKDQAAGKMTDVESALRRAADKLYDEEDASLASFAEGAAEQVGAAADYLRNHDLRGLLRDAQQIARKRPDLFLGGMFVVGMGIGRFLKATETSPQPTTNRDGGSDSQTAAGNAPQNQNREAGEDYVRRPR